MIRIFEADWVVPVFGEPIEAGAVAVKENAIVEVGKATALRKAFPESDVTSFPGCALTPGFVNCHAHLELTGLRGALDEFDFDFLNWLKRITLLRQNLENDDSIRISALVGAAEAVSSGVTAIADIGRFAYAGVEAIESVGLRGIVYQESGFFPDNANAESGFGALIEAFEEANARVTGGLIQVGLSPHAPYTVSRELFSLIGRFASDYKIPLTIHAAESKHEEDLMKRGGGLFAKQFYNEVSFESPLNSTVRFLSETGILDTSPLLAHCINVDSADIATLSKYDASVAHCPVSNAKFAHGVAPVDAMISAGIRVGLGSDSMASNNRCDLLEEARISGLFRRNQTGKDVTAESLFRMITIEGARALGIDGYCGDLREGKQADFAIIKIDGSGQVPVHDIYSTLIFATNSKSVIATYIGGEAVFEDGKCVNVDDADLRTRVREQYLR